MPIWSIGNIIAWAKDQVGVMLGTKGCSDANLNRILNEAEIQIRRAGGSESDIEQAKGEVIRICEEWHARQTDVPATAVRIGVAVPDELSNIWRIGAAVPGKLGDIWTRFSDLLSFFTNPIILVVILFAVILIMLRHR